MSWPGDGFAVHAAAWTFTSFKLCQFTYLGAAQGNAAIPG